MNINAIIVDDEPLARKELQRLLKSHNNISVMGEAENITQAKKIISANAPDVIFLDIEMPGGTGIELAEQLAKETNVSPQIVFCTAYDDFAVDAFSLNASDYLMKPINPLRLDKAIKKLTPLSSDMTPTSALNDDFKLLVKMGDGMKIIKIGDIYRFESIGNHAALYTNSGKAFLQSPLNKIEQRLEPSSYFRASRSDIIRLDQIDKLEQNISYGLTAFLKDGKQVEISRRQATRLKENLSFL